MDDKINNVVMVEGDRQALSDPLYDAIEPVQMTPEELSDLNNEALSRILNNVHEEGIFASEDPRFHHKF